MSTRKNETHSKVFFENLDGLRFMAFLMVFLSHSLYFGIKSLDIEGSFVERLIKIVVSGGNGVSIFFVLSGFLITYLILLEIEKKGKLNVPFFYVRRLLRIWPLYYVTIFIALIIYPLIRSYLGKPEIQPQEPYFYFLFLSNFDVINSENSPVASVSALEGITWSVAIEEQFYLIWPILFFITPKRFYKIIFLVTIAVSMIFRAFHHDEKTVLYYHSLSVCQDLAIGGLCAYLALYSQSFKMFFLKFSKRSIIFTYIIGAAYLMYSADIFSPFLSAIFSKLISGIFFAFIILEQNYSTNSFYKFSRNKFFDFWGKYTYGLYLLHPLALFIIEVALKRLNIHHDSNLLVAIGVAISGLGTSLLMSYLSFEHFEKWFLKLKDRFTILSKREEKPTRQEAAHDPLATDKEIFNIPITSS